MRPEGWLKRQMDKAAESYDSLPDWFKQEKPETVNYTDLNYVKVGKTPLWDKVYVYLDGEKVIGAIEASSIDGWVRCILMKKGIMCGDEIKTGNVQILFHKETPTFDVDFVAEPIVNLPRSDEDTVLPKRIVGPIKCHFQYPQEVKL